MPDADIAVTPAKRAEEKICVSQAGGQHMQLPLREVQILLADLDASVEKLRTDYEQEALLVEAVASIGDDIAEMAGPHRYWAEDQVVAILVRHGLLPDGQGAPEDRAGG